MKICLLGGGNVYALNLAKLFHKEGIEHFGIGRSYPTHEAFWVDHRYPYYRLHLIDNFEWVMENLDSERPDIIINFAAQGEGQGSFTNPTPFYQTNTVALVRLVEELKRREYLQKFVQIGTSELYGSVESPSKETDAIKPTSPYAVSKAAFDLHLQTQKDFPYLIVRPSNCFCPGQQLHRIIPYAIICALSGKKLVLHGGGVSRKSYLHADDLSRAVLYLASSGAGQVFNCGPDSPVSIRSVVELCVKACGKDFEEVVEVGPERLGQDGCYFLDSSKLKSTGWKQEISLEKGIDEMVHWVKSNPEILTMSTDWSVRP